MILLSRLLSVLNPDGVKDSQICELERELFLSCSLFPAFVYLVIISTCVCLHLGWAGLLPGLLHTPAYSWPIFYTSHLL